MWLWGGSLPEPDTEAWAPVPQDRGYEGEGSSQPSFHVTHPWKWGNSRDPHYPRDRGNGGAHGTVPRGLVFQVPEPQLPKDANLVLQVVKRNLLTQTLWDLLFVMFVITKAFQILFTRPLWQIQLFWFLGNFSHLSSNLQQHSFSCFFYYTISFLVVIISLCKRLIETFFRG